VRGWGWGWDGNTRGRCWTRGGRGGGVTLAGGRRTFFSFALPLHVKLPCSVVVVVIVVDRTLHDNDVWHLVAGFGGGAQVDRDTRAWSAQEDDSARAIVSGAEVETIARAVDLEEAIRRRGGG
jgi:hypothetical protein